MPLRPVMGKLSLPLQTPSDVWTLWETGLSLARDWDVRSWTVPDEARDLADHFYYLGALHPAWARPLHSHLVQLDAAQLRAFSLDFETWLPLLEGADDECVHVLAQQLDLDPQPWQRQAMLAAIGTPSALDALANFARKHDRERQIAALGFHVPHDGQPAQPRFSRWRNALWVVPWAGDFDALRQIPHPVGLPLSDVVSPQPPSDSTLTSTLPISWHYLSVSTADLQGMPRLDGERLHVVSPALFSDWTLWSDVERDGCYRVRALQMGEVVLEEDEFGAETPLNDTAYGRAYAELLPYNDELIYANGNTMQTPGVVGTVGGPPIGLYPNPQCPQCTRLMFHVLTVSSDVRDYGKGWRALFVCEECSITACQATMWN